MSPDGENVDFMLRTSKPEETKQADGGERGKRKKIAQPSKQLPKLKIFLFMMKNTCAPSHKNHTFAVKILHRNFILTFYHLSFFGSQFQRRSTTG